MKIAGILNTIFRKTESFFAWKQSQSEESDPLIVLYEVLPEKMSLSALEVMTNHVALLQRAGLLITINILTEQTPIGYIGKMSVWYEGLSKCPRCWLLPQEYFDKIQSVSL